MKKIQGYRRKNDEMKNTGDSDIVQIEKKMISRRDKLLSRPWEKMRFENHKRKVATASPVVDIGPPPTRNHVKLKLKKCQKEVERCEKIAQDNVRLLQRLGAIMKVNRLDNYWTEAPPNFLNREALFKPKTKSSHVTKIHLQESKDISPVRQRVCAHVARCKSCGGKNEKIIQERVPWPKESKSSSTKVFKPIKNCTQCGIGMCK